MRVVFSGKVLKGRNWRCSIMMFRVLVQIFWMDLDGPISKAQSDFAQDLQQQPPHHYVPSTSQTCSGEGCLPRRVGEAER